MFYSRVYKSPSFEKIRSQILSRWILKSDKNCTVIALISRLPREGVTTVTNGLARSFMSANTGNTGNVLLLYAGRKHPRRASVLDVTLMEDVSILSDFIIRDNKLGCDTIRLANTGQDSIGLGDTSTDDDVPGLDISFDEDGTILDHASDAGSRNEQIQRIFRMLKKKYNLILVDAGSLNNSNGTFWLLNSDLNILVIDCMRTTRETLEYQQREFENSSISIDGSILNKRRFPIPNFLYWLAK